MDLDTLFNLKMNEQHIGQNKITLPGTFRSINY